MWKEPGTSLKTALLIQHLTSMSRCECCQIDVFLKFDLFTSKMILITTIFRAKFGLGLSSGDYSKPPPEDDTIKVPEGIRPQMFKSLIGKGHPEFSTKRQQDAQEFLLHLIGVIEVTPLFWDKIMVLQRVSLIGPNLNHEYCHITEKLA